MSSGMSSGMSSEELPEEKHCQNARLVVAGTQSGVGKTTLTVGLIAALRQRGLVVQPYKVGPDYIDPTYHTLAANRPCRNLDAWMVPPERVQALFTHAAAAADLSIIEGVMGLYDGFSYEYETGSTAEVAKLIKAPVILVLNGETLARSAGAMVLGYRQFDLDLPLAGFIVNYVGGERHGQGIAKAIEQTTGLPVLGWLPRDTTLEIPERHLGLVPTAEPGYWRAFIEAAAERVARYLDLDSVLTLAQNATPLPASTSTVFWQSLPRVDHCPVIAVAQDEAFNFTYEDNLDLLRHVGAEVAFFSPLHDETLPPATTAIILSGGFPELFAAQLSANGAMYQALQDAHRRKLFIYAECGGLMYLTQTITDLEGQTYPMVGLLPGHSSMAPRRLTLGYRLAQAVSDSWLFTTGEIIRGHEFHYSTWTDRPADLPPAYHLLPYTGQGKSHPEGANLNNLWASYVHLHFWSNPKLASRFVKTR